MPRNPAPSLDAWPGETARPPLRLLETPRSLPARRQHASAALAPAAGWLQRLRQLLRDPA